MKPHRLGAAFAVLAFGIPMAAAAPPSLSTAASALELGPGDLRIEQLDDGGYHLYVRAKAGLGSVLLTESTRDPALKSDSYAFRALEDNAVNGGETRVLDGRRMPRSEGSYFLVDSSPGTDPIFGKAFHIFIPWVVAWGYPWARSGKIFIHDGTYVNIRAFAKPYADYSGSFGDNPYLIRVSQRAATRPPESSPVSGAAVPASVSAPIRASVPLPGATAGAATVSFRPELYYPETIAAFRGIVSANGGELRAAATDRDIVAQIDSLLESRAGQPLDLVICVDTSVSMRDGLEALKVGLPSMLSKNVARFPRFRLGLVAFKDYFEEYLYKRFEFTRDVGVFASQLASLQSGGGRDIPEAVYEGLYAAASEFPWEAETRLVVLVGDAPPHPLPRGAVDEQAVDDAARTSAVVIDAVAVPK